MYLNPPVAFMCCTHWSPHNYVSKKNLSIAHFYSFSMIIKLSKYCQMGDKFSSKLCQNKEKREKLFLTQLTQFACALLPSKEPSSNFPFLSCDNFLTLFVICWSFDSFMRGRQKLEDEKFSDKGNMPKRLFSGSTSTICFISFPTLFMTFLFITQGFLLLPPPALSIHSFIHSCMYDAFFEGHVFCDLYTSFRRTWTFFFSFYRLHVEARQPVDGEELQKRSDKRHVDAYAL